MDALLDIRRLQVDYAVRGGYLSAVRDFNLSMRRGEVFALVGESGCGKSTVSYTIMRLLQGNERVSGEILLEGRDLLRLTDAEMAKMRGGRIGMIFQNPLDSLNPVYSSGYQVSEAIRLEEKRKAEVRKRLIELYEAVRISEAELRIHSYPHELSGGMRQRVMIAMMLARNPDLLIADEPTTALDVTVEAQILQLLRELKDERHSAILLITHNFGLVAEIADRVGIMYAGELVELASVFDIFESARHPYSQALLSALPRFSKREGRLKALAGTVPKIIGEFCGCRFANRCPYAREDCRGLAPELREISTGHFLRCFREADEW